MQLVGNIQSADSTLECNLRETFKTFKTRLSSSECKSRNEYGKIVVYGSGEQVSTTTFNGPWIEVSPSKFPSESFSSVAVESIKINLLVNCIALQELTPPNNDLLLSATQWTGSSFHIIPFKTTHKHVPVQIASNLLPHWCLHSIAVPLLPTTQKLHSNGSISAVLLARFFQRGDLRRHNASFSSSPAASVTFVGRSETTHPSWTQSPTVQQPHGAFHQGSALLINSKLGNGWL